jgi:hypothetical protein
MKAWKLALTILVFGTSVYLPKAQAISISKNQTSQSESPVILAQANKSSAWKTISSSNWNFSGVLPTESGITTTQYSDEYVSLEGKISQGNDSTYAIISGQYLIDISQVDPKELLNLFGSEFQDKFRKLHQSRNIFLGRYPGKEYTYKEGKRITKLRIFIADQRIYMLYVESPVVGDASTFFNAFKIL